MVCACSASEPRSSSRRSSSPRLKRIAEQRRTFGRCGHPVGGRLLRRRGARQAPARRSSACSAMNAPVEDWEVMKAADPQEPARRTGDRLRRHGRHHVRGRRGSPASGAVLAAILTRIGVGRARRRHLVRGRPGDPPPVHQRQASRRAGASRRGDGPLRAGPADHPRADAARAGPGREYPTLDARDVVHVATCIHEGIPTIVSPDRAFDQVAEVRRIDPLAFADPSFQPA